MIYTNNIKVQHYDCDTNNRLKISGVMKYMQQTSGDQLDSLGLPHDKLIREHMVFLLSKMCIKVHKMPCCAQQLIVGTAAVTTKGARFVREFFVDSAAGERMVSALTLWLLVDPQSRRILRPVRFPYALPFHPSIIHGAIGDLSIPRLAEKGNAVITKQPVRYSHVDNNSHVNNSVYGDFVCDALPHEELTQRGIDTLVISFQNEARWGHLLEMETHSLSSNEYFIAGKHAASPCFEALVQLMEKPLAHTGS